MKRTVKSLKHRTAECVKRYFGANLDFFLFLKHASFIPFWDSSTWFYYNSSFSSSYSLELVQWQKQPKQKLRVATYKHSAATETFQTATDVIIAIISIETLSDPFINGPNAQGHWNL